MKSYDIPDVPADPEQAQQALNRLRADALADPEHPAFFSAHPQARDFAEYSTRLYKVIATAEVEAKDLAAAQALEAARAETGDLTPAECLARARELTLTHGYVNGTMAPEERAALAKEISTLYLVGCQQEPSTPEEMETEDSDDPDDL
jgi:hypothetical protein